jgi:hypothetical protein
MKGLRVLYSSAKSRSKKQSRVGTNTHNVEIAWIGVTGMDWGDGRGAWCLRRTCVGTVHYSHDHVSQASTQRT